MNSTHITAPAPHTDAQRSAAYLLAARAVVTDIETEAWRVDGPDGTTWWNVTPMVDPQEQPPEFADMARLAIDYALAVGICAAHPTRAHHLRVLWREPG